MFGNITLQYPYVLLLLGLFIICAFFCKAKSSSYFVPHLNLFESSTKLGSSTVVLLKWITIVFALIALSSPVKELNIINSKNKGIDIVLSLDTSGSMRQRGFNKENIQHNRWDVVSSIVKDFIEKRVNDNIALVVFGQSVMTASPLSYDKNAQKKIIDSLGIGIVGEKTALVDSIATSINILKQRSSKSKVIILLTDGNDTASKIPLNIVTKMAKKYGIKIYAVAIGVRDTFMLNELSNTNGGKTFTARSKDDLKKIYEKINLLEKSEIDQNKIVLKEYLFFYPLFISFLSLLMFVYFKNRRENI
jgi:Ca-activated chloride channel family protein